MHYLCSLIFSQKSTTDSEYLFIYCYYKFADLKNFAVNCYKLTIIFETTLIFIRRDNGGLQHCFIPTIFSQQFVVKIFVLHF